MSDLKKIEAIVKTDKVGEVTDAMRKAGAKGVSITQTKGQGSAERPMIRGGRGTTQYRAEFNIMNSVMTLADDLQVPTIVKAIANSARTEGAGAGIIYVTNVEDIINISSLERDSSAL